MRIGKSLQPGGERIVSIRGYYRVLAHYKHARY